jgi:hypothetical protein
MSVCLLCSEPFVDRSNSQTKQFCGDPCRKRAKRRGLKLIVVNRKRVSRVPREIGSVPVGPFQERFNELIEMGYSAPEMAEWIGWRQRGCGDGERLKRAVGLKKYQERGGEPMVYRKRIQEENALKLCKAFGLYPRDVGL